MREKLGGRGKEGRKEGKEEREGKKRGRST